MLLLALLSLACAQMGEGGKPRRSRDGDMATSVEMECYQVNKWVLKTLLNNTMVPPQ